MYMQARLCMRCMPAVLCRLYHYISARQAAGSACDLLFYITALPSILFWTLSGSLPTPPPLRCAALRVSQLSSLDFSANTCSSEQFLLTHCQAKLAGVYITETGGLLTWRSFQNTAAPLSNICGKLKDVRRHPTVAFRKTKACMWSDSYWSTYKHVWHVNK